MLTLNILVSQTRHFRHRLGPAILFVPSNPAAIRPVQILRLYEILALLEALSLGGLGRLFHVHILGVIVDLVDRRLRLL